MKGGAMLETTTRELAYRASDGVEVVLLWNPSDDRLSVVVEDTRLDERFRIQTRADNALEVFYHPYAYAPVWIGAASALAV
jgi:hypothetical protein